jgi:hypothetical protein
MKARLGFILTCLVFAALLLVSLLPWLVIVLVERCRARYRVVAVSCDVDAVTAVQNPLPTDRQTAAAIV